MESHVQARTFLGLPAEMRVKIYSFSLPARIPVSEFRRQPHDYDEGEDRNIVLDPNKYELNLPENELPRFLLTSRTIYNEARPLFIRHLAFDKAGDHGLNTDSHADHYKALVRKRSTIWLLNLKEIQHAIVDRYEIPHPTITTPSQPRLKPLVPGEARQSIEPPFPYLKTITIRNSRNSLFLHPEVFFHKDWLDAVRQGKPRDLLSIMRQMLRMEIKGRYGDDGRDNIGLLNELAEQYHIVVELPRYHAHIYEDEESCRAEAMATIKCEWDWNQDKLRIEIRRDAEMVSCPDRCQDDREYTNKWLKPERVWDELPKHDPVYPWETHRGELLLDVVVFMELGEKHVVYLEGYHKVHPAYSIQTSRAYTN